MKPAIAIRSSIGLGLAKRVHSCDVEGSRLRGPACTKPGIHFTESREHALGTGYSPPLQATRRTPHTAATCYSYSYIERWDVPKIVVRARILVERIIRNWDPDWVCFWGLFPCTYVVYIPCRQLYLSVDCLLCVVVTMGGMLQQYRVDHHASDHGSVG